MPDADPCPECGFVHDLERVAVRDIPPTTIRLQPKTLAKLDAMARQLGVSRNALIDRAVRQLLISV